jgi:periplasmic divalent cation tolerance protein
MEIRVVLVTAPNADVGTTLARDLVTAGLAACANIIPGVRSIYRWQGELCDDQEVLIVIKTQADRIADLVERVNQLHPYDLPEVLALPTAGGSEPYLAWVRDETSAG